jgi:polyhydroxyalkanoate synthesis regulator protein
MECESLEEISRKLEMLHFYEDQIAAVKASYNSSQMFHILDEAEERGEQIAKAAEKSAPKTAEQRNEEMVEEALGIDENEGMLSEIMDNLSEIQDQMEEELEEMPEEQSENIQEQSEEVYDRDASTMAVNYENEI